MVNREAAAGNQQAVSGPSPPVFFLPAAYYLVPAAFCLLLSGFCLRAEAAPPARTRYQLEFNVDFEQAAFTGREVLSYLNRSAKPIETLFFHLYPNYQTEKHGKQEFGLQVQSVTGGGRPLRFEVTGGLVKVPLPAAVLPDEAVELTIEFTGRVPQLSEEETGTLAHLMRELGSAAIREPAMRSPYETFLYSGDVMVLGYAYPILAVQRGHKWQTDVPDMMGSLEFAEVADYQVRVTAARGLTVITSNLERSAPGEAAGRQVWESAGEQMRDFALIVGRNLRTATAQAGATRVRSVFRDKDAVVGERLLKTATQAVAVYNDRFGPYPYAELDLVGAPLLPGHSEYEFSGLVLLASAYYIDFTGPAARQLPGFIREQSAAFEDGLEFTAAHGIAHQWWGVAVESNPYQHSFIDEALAGTASVLYLEQSYNKSFAAQQVDTHVKAAYRVYRTFGGEDTPADRPPKEFINEFHYAAIVQTKGTLFLLAARELVGAERFGAALARYYEKYRFRIATPDDLLGELEAGLSKEEREALGRLYRRWLRERHGDADIGAPAFQVSIGSGPNTNETRRNIFEHVGRFFLRIGKTAVRPF